MKTGGEDSAMPEEGRARFIDEASRKKNEVKVAAASTGGLGRQSL